MNPSDITNLIETAGRIRKSEKHPMPFFLLSWTAWEAMRMRLLRVVINRQGWPIKTATLVLGEQRVSTMEHTACLLEELGAGNPNEWTGISGKIWRKLIEIQPIRNRLSHGFMTLNPALIRAAGDLVFAFLEYRCWLEAIKIPDINGGIVRTGCLLKRTNIKKADALKSEDSLRSKLTLGNNRKRGKGRKTLPDISGLIALSSVIKE